MTTIPKKPTYADFKERACPEHPDKWLAMACSTCNDTFVCLTCISSKHSGHKFSEVEEYMSIKEHLLNKLKLEIDAKIKRLDARIKRVERAREDNHKNAREMVDFIESRAKDMKQQIDQISQDYVGQCTHIESTNKQLLEHLEERMKKHFGDLSEISNRSANVLDTVNFYEYLTTEMKLRFSNNRPYDKFPRLLQSGVIMSDKQTRMMTQFGYMDKSEWVPDGCAWGGERHEMDVTGNITPYHIEIVGGFVLPTERQVLLVCPIDNSMAWTVYTGSNQAELRSLKGEIKGTMKVKEGVKINDMVHSTDRQRTLCCAQGSVRKVLPYGKYQVLFPTNHYASSVCEAMEDGCIIVCHDEKGKLVKYSSGGDVKKVIIDDADGWKLFSWPRKVRMNRRNGDLAVIEESNPRHVLVMNKDLEELCRFHGGTKPSDVSVDTGSSQDDDQQFNPRDITFDRNGDIVIADYGKRAVIVIDREGREIRTLWRDDVPVTSLGIQPNGKLWMGFNDGSIKIIRYLRD